MKLNKYIKKCIMCMVLVLCTVLFADFPANAQQPFGGIGVKYTLDNGFEYTVNTFLKYYPEKEVAEDETDGETATEAAPEDLLFQGMFETETERVAAITKNCALVLPYGVQNKPVTLVVPQDWQLSLDGSPVADGTQLVLTKGTHTLDWNGETYTLFVMYTSNIPQVYITVAEDAMEKVHLDKDHRESGEITITDGQITEYSGNLEYIKGRGNATWDADKKPYNIKLEKKVSLFDMGISRKYSLMANATDDTIIKNKLGMDMADKIGIDYNLQSQHIDLFVNNEYMGNYLLTERVEVDTYRVNIRDLEKLNEDANDGADLATLPSKEKSGSDRKTKNGSYKWVELPKEFPVNIGGGYLLEFELDWRYGQERCGFWSEYGQPVLLQGPENASRSQVEYIKNYYCDFEQAVLSDDGYNSKGMHYSDYIDVESFAKMYLMQEFVQNLDAAITSFYMYKDVDSKLTACTVWDLDMAFGKNIERNGYNISKADNIWAMDGSLNYDDSHQLKTVFTLLCQHGDFRREITQQWEQWFRPNVDYLKNQVYALYGIVGDSAAADRYKWNVVSSDPDIAVQDYYQYIEALMVYIHARDEFLADYFDTADSYLQYSANGGSGVMIEKAGFAQGENATAKENSFTYGDAQFIGWNTAKDGSGTTYIPGDIVDMSKGDTVLYAQWDGVTADVQSGAVQTQPQQSGIFAAVINWFKNLFN